MGVMDSIAEVKKMKTQLQMSEKPPEEKKPIAKQ